MAKPKTAKPEQTAFEQLIEAAKARIMKQMDADSNELAYGAVCGIQVEDDMGGGNLLLQMTLRYVPPIPKEELN